MVSMGPDEFDELVGEALEGIPPVLRREIDNLVVMVEDEPSYDDLLGVGLDPETETLFGLYQGVALPERGASYGGELPDRVVIYRLPLQEACETRAELVQEIRDTVVHEIGHYFGFDEDQLP